MITFIPYGALILPTVEFLGLVGVSSLMLATAIVSLIWVLSMAARLIGERPEKVVATLLKPILAAATMASVVFLISRIVSPTIEVLLGLVILGTMIYLTLIYVLTKGEIFREVSTLTKRLIAS